MTDTATAAPAIDYAALADAIFKRQARAESEAVQAGEAEPGAAYGDWPHVFVDSKFVPEESGANHPDHPDYVAPQPEATTSLPDEASALAPSAPVAAAPA